MCTGSEYCILKSVAKEWKLKQTYLNNEDFDSCFMAFFAHLSL